MTVCRNDDTAQKPVSKGDVKIRRLRAPPVSMLRHIDMSQVVAEALSLAAVRSRIMPSQVQNTTSNEGHHGLLEGIVLREIRP
jgi:hypothetical protein